MLHWYICGTSEPQSCPFLTSAGSWRPLEFRRDEEEDGRSCLTARMTHRGIHFKGTFLETSAPLRKDLGWDFYGMRNTIVTCVVSDCYLFFLACGLQVTHGIVESC